MLGIKDQQRDLSAERHPRGDADGGRAAQRPRCEQRPRVARTDVRGPVGLAQPIDDVGVGDAPGEVPGGEHGERAVGFVHAALGQQEAR
jgi:hypothetical protein